MNELERVVIEMLLAGDDPDLSTLRDQLSTASVSKREYSEAGFFTHFEVPLHIRPASRDVVIGDVYADVSGLSYSVGFLLFVREGILDTLEGFVVDGAWRQDAQLLRAFYVHPEATGDRQLVETKERDLSWVLNRPR